jgi:hypothetical protein
VHVIFSDNLLKNLDFPQSCINEAPGDVYSQNSLEASQSLWTEEATSSDRGVPDKIASLREIETIEIELTDGNGMILVGRLSDSPDLIA